MKLTIEAKFHKDGKEETASVEIPFEDGTHTLPEVYPFSRRINYVGPDAGYSLNWIGIDAGRRRITFGYNWIVDLDENGTAAYDSGSIFFLFRLE